jgi:hypothetical protein
MRKEAKQIHSASLLFEAKMFLKENRRNLYQPESDSIAKVLDRSFDLKNPLPLNTKRMPLMIYGNSPEKCNMLMLASLSSKRSLENARAIDFMLKGQFGISHGFGRRLTQHYGEDSIQAVFRKMRALFRFLLSSKEL